MPDPDPPQPTQDKPLTPQDRGVAAGLLAGLTPRNAMRNSRMRPTRANKARLRPGGDIHGLVLRALDRNGAAVNRSASVIGEAHKATKIEYFAHEGIVTDERETIDHRTRLSAADQALRLRGAYPRPPEDPVDEANKPPRIVAIQFNVLAQGKAGTTPAPSGITAGLVIGIGTPHTGDNGHG